MEVHLLDRDDDLYGQRMRVQFCTWVRGQRRYDSVDELVATALRVGEVNLTVMEMLDRANTTRFGHPSPAEVKVTVLPPQRTDHWELADVAAQAERIRGMYLDALGQAERREPAVGV